MKLLNLIAAAALLIVGPSASALPAAFAEQIASTESEADPDADIIRYEFFNKDGKKIHALHRRKADTSATTSQWKYDEQGRITYSRYGESESHYEYFNEGSGVTRATKRTANSYEYTIYLDEREVFWYRKQDGRAAATATTTYSDDTRTQIRKHSSGSVTTKRLDKRGNEIFTSHQYPGSPLRKTTRTFTEDNQVKTAESSNGLLENFYTDAGKIRETVLNGNITAHYVYDHQERLILQNLSGLSSAYFYDDENRTKTGHHESAQSDYSSDSFERFDEQQRQIHRRDEYHSVEGTYISELYRFYK